MQKMISEISAFLLSCYKLYVGDREVDAKYPLTFTEDNLSKLPPTFISIGESEMLLDQAVQLADTLKNKGTKVSLKRYETMFHTFWNSAPTIKEANDLIADMAIWLKNP